MADAPNVVVVGGGGHAKVVIEALRLSNATLTIAVLDADASRVGASVSGAPIVGGDAMLAELARNGSTWFVIAVAGTRDNRPRARLFAHACSVGLAPLTVAHPAAVVSPAAAIGAGCQILPGAVVNAEARLDEHVIVNTGAIVEHDCRIGAHAHIATGARLCGGVEVGAYTHVGAGSVVRQLLRIGSGSVVGIGAAVVKNVPDDCIVAGVPAKELGS